MIKTSLEIVNERYAPLFASIRDEYQRMFSFLRARGFAQTDLELIRSKNDTRVVYDVVSSQGKNFRPDEYMGEYKAQKQKQAGVVNGNVVVLDAYRTTERFQEPRAQDYILGRDGQLIRQSGAIASLATAASIIFGINFVAPTDTAYANTAKKDPQAVVISYQAAKTFEIQYKALLTTKAKDGVIDPEEVTAIHAFFHGQKFFPDVSGFSNGEIQVIKSRTIDEWRKPQLERGEKIKPILKTLDDAIFQNYPGLGVEKSTYPVTGIAYDARRLLTPTEQRVLEEQITLYNSLDGVKPIEVQNGGLSIEFLARTYIAMKATQVETGKPEPFAKLADLVFSIPQHQTTLGQLQRTKEWWLNSDFYRGEYWFAGFAFIDNVPDAWTKEAGKLEKMLKDYLGKDISVQQIGVKYPWFTKIHPLLGLAAGIGVPILRKILVTRYVNRRWDIADTVGVGLNVVGGLVVLDAFHPLIFPARMVGAFYLIEPLRTAMGMRRSKWDKRSLFKED